MLPVSTFHAPQEGSPLISVALHGVSGSVPKRAKNIGKEPTETWEFKGNPTHQCDEIRP